MQRRAGKRSKQSTTRKEISNKKYQAKFSADILPITTENRFRDILMLWAANFSGESYFYTKRQCKCIWITEKVNTLQSRIECSLLSLSANRSKVQNLDLSF